MHQFLVYLLRTQRLPYLILLFLSTVFAVGLLYYRVHISQHMTYFFLLWNLFLAAIPLGISTIAVYWAHLGKYKLLIFCALGAWLLFFPNSPYILTDLFHLKTRSGSPLWFDLGLLLTFAWTGLMMGMISLIDVQQIVKKYFGNIISEFFSITVLCLCAFGIYLGRFQRWNSWDLFTQPGGLLNDISERVVDPAQDPRMLGMTLLFSGFLLLGYYTLRMLVRADRSLETSIPVNSKKPER